MKAFLAQWLPLIIVFSILIGMFVMDAVVKQDRTSILTASGASLLIVVYLAAFIKKVTRERTT